MAKAKNKKPVVSSITQVIKQTCPSDVIELPSETIQKKRDMLGIIDKSLAVFMKNLEAGTVDMSTSSDLERLVKLRLLVSGEADSRIGKPQGDVEKETTIVQAGLDMSKIDKILDSEDPRVKALYDELYVGYNELNNQEINSKPKSH